MDELADNINIAIENNFKTIKANETFYKRVGEECRELARLFREQINEYFNFEYLIRYYLCTMIFGAVDNLGKNAKITTWDGRIWYFQFYDLDTTIGLDNTGFLKYDSDIEVEAGIFNTSGSKLWTKVARVFDAEIKEQYSLMRQKQFTVDNIMKYLYGEQINKIPETFYKRFSCL